jgi:hypothetical protein
VGREGWKTEATQPPVAAFPSSPHEVSTYPLTHQGRWAWKGLELMQVRGLLLSSVVPPECVGPPLLGAGERRD